MNMVAARTKNMDKCILSFFSWTERPKDSKPVKTYRADL